MANVEEKKNELDDKKIFTSNAQRTTTVAKGETIIELKDVTIRFNKNNLKVDNLKEYFIRLVTKQLMFQEFIALKDINLDIKKGEAWGFLGTNGAGKSTLLKALELGVYDHVAGDGREYVITDRTAVKIRAEDGRSIRRTDISMFINGLPNGKDTVSLRRRTPAAAPPRRPTWWRAWRRGPPCCSSTRTPAPPTS